jgi:hypothetical protein
LRTIRVHGDVVHDVVEHEARDAADQVRLGPGLDQRDHHNPAGDEHPEQEQQ